MSLAPVWACFYEKADSNIQTQTFHHNDAIKLQRRRRSRPKLGRWAGIKFVVPAKRKPVPSPLAGEGEGEGAVDVIR